MTWTLLLQTVPTGQQGAAMGSHRRRTWGPAGGGAERRKGKRLRRRPADPFEQNTGPQRGPVTQTWGLPQHHRFSEANEKFRRRLSLPLVLGPWGVTRGMTYSALSCPLQEFSHLCSPESSWLTWDKRRHCY